MALKSVKYLYRGAIKSGLAQCQRKTACILFLDASLNDTLRNSNGAGLFRLRVIIKGTHDKPRHTEIQGGKGTIGLYLLNIKGRVFKPLDDCALHCNGRQERGNDGTIRGAAILGAELAVPADGRPTASLQQQATMRSLDDVR